MLQGVMWPRLRSHTPRHPSNVLLVTGQPSFKGRGNRILVGGATDLVTVLSLPHQCTHLILSPYSDASSTACVQGNHILNGESWNLSEIPKWSQLWSGICSLLPSSVAVDKASQIKTVLKLLSVSHAKRRRDGPGWPPRDTAREVLASFALWALFSQNPCSWTSVSQRPVSVLTFHWESLLLDTRA